VERQKRAAVERDDVVRGILSIIFEGAAVAKRLSIATRSGETNPMRLVVGRLAGIVNGLISGAIVGDDLTFVADLFALPLFGNRQLASRPDRPGRVLSSGSLATTSGIVSLWISASSSLSSANVRSRSSSIALRIWLVVQFAHCSALAAISRSQAREDGSLYLMSVSMTEASIAAATHTYQVYREASRMALQYGADSSGQELLASVAVAKRAS
jgi:hypothetical protein